MEAKISVPQYELRGFSLWGFRDMAHCMDFLFDGGRVKQGTLVAMNAEKILKAEEDQALHALLDEAEYKYADGISMCARFAANTRRRTFRALRAPICGKP